MTVPEIDVVTLSRLHAEGVTIIDVRNPDEYETAHVPGALMISLPELPERVDDIPESGPLYLICAVGARSRRASEFLVSCGRDDVTNVAGGTNAWIQAGYQTTTGPNP